MRVYVRHCESATVVYFCKWQPTELEELVAKINQAGGFYYHATGSRHLITDTQFCLEVTSAYAELILNEEPVE